MTSKEALEKLYNAMDENLLYNQSGIVYPIDLYLTIEQDLEQLEKYKNAIELLKKYVGFKLVIDPVDSVRGITIKYEYSDISKQEYALLKEVLENE